MSRMIKIKEHGSHFELVDSQYMKTKAIVQICTEMVYINSNDYAVFLAEVLDDDEERKDK